MNTHRQLSPEDIAAHLEDYADQAAAGLDRENAFTVIVGTLNASDPAREAAMSTASNRGMRFIDNDNIDQISYEDIGPNDFVYLHTRVHEKHKSVDDVYRYISGDQFDGGGNLENKLKALDNIIKNEKFHASSGGTMSPEMGAIRDRLLKQAKAGASMTRFDVDREGVILGPGITRYHENMGCALVVEMSQPNPLMDIRLRNMSYVFEIEPQSPQPDAPSGSDEDSFHGRLSAARKARSGNTDEPQLRENSPRIG